MSDQLRRMRRCFYPWQWFQDEDGTDPSVISDEEDFMWVYREVKGIYKDTGNDKLTYQVGYFVPDKSWFCDSEHPTRESAARRVRYLMGGEEK